MFFQSKVFVGVYKGQRGGTKRGFSKGVFKGTNFEPNCTRTFVETLLKVGGCLVVLRASQRERVFLRVLPCAVSLNSHV